MKTSILKHIGCIIDWDWKCELATLHSGYDEILFYNYNVREECH